MKSLIEDDEFRSALVTGCPGSGKTTVAAMRFIRLARMKRNPTLLTFHKLLAAIIEAQVRGREATTGHVKTFMKWHTWMSHGEHVDGYLQGLTREELARRLKVSPLSRHKGSEVLFDETQDLPAFVCELIPAYFERAFVSTDDGQQVHDHGSSARELEELLGDNYAYCRKETLNYNYRNTYETYRFARQFMPRDNLVAWDPNTLERLKRDGRQGRKPEVISYKEVSLRDEHMLTTLRNALGNVGVLCRGVDEVKATHGLLIRAGIPSSTYHSELKGTPAELERYLVTTYKSAKGIEFDTVVLPRVNYETRIPKEWYVACTRARGQLFVYRDLAGRDIDPLQSFEPDSFSEQILGQGPTDQDMEIPF